MLGGQEMRLFVIPILAPTLLEGCGLMLLRCIRQNPSSSTMSKWHAS
jgi:hypothetical protein